jgi:hypothetical protein
LWGRHLRLRARRGRVAGARLASKGGAVHADPSPSRPLTKAEVNARYYETVGGEIAFITEAASQSRLHATAVARLIARHAALVGRRQLRLLEIGANTCAFATSLLSLLRELHERGEAELDGLDYFAVDFSRNTLETVLAHNKAGGSWTRILVPSRREAATARPLIGSLLDEHAPRVALHLVHSDANELVRSSSGRFDFVILNELLDDLPCRVFYAAADGHRSELAAHASADDGTWRVRISATHVGDGESPGLSELPPGTVTATSPESLSLMTGISGLLESGGMLLVHDYGFMGGFAGVDQYEPLPKTLPSFVTMEFPPESESGFPHSFFRVFGNEERRIVQITNDVNFGELADALDRSGKVIVLPHGNALLQTRAWPEILAPDDGVFLSECIFLRPDDDLRAVLARLHAEQEELRERYVRSSTGGRTSMFSDLVYVKN